MLTGKTTLDQSNVYRWYKTLSEGQKDVNEERTGRPSTSKTNENVDKLKKKIVLANRQITIREVAGDPNIWIGSYHSILANNLDMCCQVRAETYDQKQHRVNIAQEMLALVRDHPNTFQRVITGDESWVDSYDVENKAQ